ncbi:TVP38/TMEM64 family protein [Paenibacillus humicola]|uniref:TVP38/TMEM64 family protein n=1 Tax=Paenibacillus humicola TaxID=3110540 RepID=UPI00237A73A0|nr:TVP38/TMEM64 family protein [Paenibacillus humicola]
MADYIQEWFRELRHLDLDHLQRTLRSYSAYGPLPGILFPFAEAFLSFLPLIVFVAANANIYGFWLGSLYSWIGVCSGSIVLFWIARKLGGRLGGWLQRRFPKTERFFNWIGHKGFTPIFLFACFPFSPSVLMNIVSGLSQVPFRTFALAILLGKAVMISSISLISFNIGDIAQQPWRIVVMIVMVVGMWFGGRKLEARYQTK